MFSPSLPMFAWFWLPLLFSLEAPFLSISIHMKPYDIYLLNTDFNLAYRRKKGCKHYTAEVQTCPVCSQPFDTSLATSNSLRAIGL